MGKIVNFPTATELESNAEFILDFARYGEGLLSQKFLRSKYKFSNEVWESLGNSERLLDLIEAEKVRRMRSGAAKREKAQLHVLRVPDVAASIAFDASSNARHRLDAGQLLDKLAANGPEAVPAADRFVITINLGADSHGRAVIEHYDKSIAPDPNPISPVVINTDTPATIASEPAAIASEPPTSDPVEASFAAMMRLG
jgi:hypothetical protein